MTKQKHLPDVCGSFGAVSLYFSYEMAIVVDVGGVCPLCSIYEQMYTFLSIQMVFLPGP